MNLPALFGVTPEYHIGLELATLPIDLAACLFLGFSRRHRSHPYRAFQSLLYVLTAATAFDIAAVYVTSLHAYVSIPVHTVFHTIDQLLGTICAFRLVKFILSYALEDRHIDTAIFITRAILSVFLYILMSNFATGYVFTYDRYGNYSHGPLYMLVNFIFPLIYVAFGMIFILPRREYYSREFRWGLRIALLVVIGLLLYQILFLEGVQMAFFAASVGIWIILPVVLRESMGEEMRSEAVEGEG